MMKTLFVLLAIVCFVESQTTPANATRELIRQEIKAERRLYEEKQELLRLKCEWDQFLNNDNNCESCNQSVCIDPYSPRCVENCEVYASYQIGVIKRNEEKHVPVTTDETPDLMSKIALGLACVLYPILAVLVWYFCGRKTLPKLSELAPYKADLTKRFLSDCIRNRQPTGDEESSRNDDVREDDHV